MTVLDAPSVDDPRALLGSLPPSDVPARLERLRAALGPAGCDALVVSHLTNIRYLTGFTGSAALLLVTGERIVFVTDGRYTDQSASELAASGLADSVDLEIVAAEPDRRIAEAASGLRRVGLEADHVSWSAQLRYAGDLFTGAELVATRALVEELRLTKDRGELARIRAACAIADAALAEVRHRLAERPTEAEFGAELDQAMRRLGAADVSFETIVAAGPNGARPHHRPSGHRIAEGELVVIDFGALVEGYHSDMTRTLVVGEPDSERGRMLEVVLEAQAAGVAAVGAGVAAREVDAACRGLITAAGMGEAFVHSTGHGVGLDIHEEPRVSQRSDATLIAGHVVTVEPGVYLPELGGVRIEDTVVVTEDGAERLTLTPKDPVLR